MAFPFLPTGNHVYPVPDPLVLGSSGALLCSTRLEVNSIQWLDSLNNILAETITGEKSLNLPLGNINDTLHNAVYTCIANTTIGLIFREVVIVDTTGKSNCSVSAMYTTPCAPLH